MKKLWTIVFCFVTLSGMAQDSAVVAVSAGPHLNQIPAKASAQEALDFRQPSPGFHMRKLAVDGLGVGIYGGMLVGLSQAWYSGYQKSSFHTFNDIGEWQQMDKVGHAWSVYSMSHIGYGLWRWSGYSNKQATMLATGSGLAFMLGVEYLDGRSSEWGWSWGDAGADAFGAVLFASQQLTWKEQKFRLKFSSHINHYPGELEARAHKIFGKSKPEKMLKDYNAQTYWLSFPLPVSWKLPSWLRLSIGYGADGMFGGYENFEKDPSGTVSFSRPDIKRYRQWYLAPDIDLTKIKTKSRFLRTVFYSVNIVKFPTPSLEFSNGSFKGHLLHF